MTLFLLRTFMCMYLQYMHTCIFSMDPIESTFLNTDPANSGDLSTGASSVMDSTPSSQPPATTTTAETSPKATPSSQPPARTTTAEMSLKTSPLSQPSSSSSVSPPVPEGVGSGPPAAAIGGAVGAVVVLAVIGVIVLIVVGAFCVVRKKKYTVSKPALYDMPPDAYCTFGE